MKHKIHLIMCLTLLVIMSGCAKPVHKNWIPVGGSKSDATIKLAYSFDPTLEKPMVQHQQAQELAIRKCKTWGYDSAEEFGGELSHCSHMEPRFGGLACIQMVVEKEFQCIGGTTIKNQ